MDLKLACDECGEIHILPDIGIVSFLCPKCTIKVENDMGWSSGTEVFDTMVEAIDKNVIDHEARPILVGKLYNILTDKDWDTFCESDFYNTDWVRKAVEAVDPDVFDEEDADDF